jgi:hypothetical protein
LLIVSLRRSDEELVRMQRMQPVAARLCVGLVHLVRLRVIPLERASLLMKPRGKPVGLGLPAMKSSMLGIRCRLGF